MKDYLNTIIAGVNRVFYLYNYSDIHKIFGINDKGYINDLAIIKTLQDKILFADTSNMSKDERKSNNWLEIYFVKHLWQMWKLSSRPKHSRYYSVVCKEWNDFNFKRRCYLLQLFLLWTR